MFMSAFFTSEMKLFCMHNFFVLGLQLFDDTCNDVPMKIAKVFSCLF